MIPLIVHQTEESCSSISPSVQEAMSEFRGANPECEFRFYDAIARRNFIAENFSQRVLSAYDAIASDYNVAKADLFRYCVVYCSGGFYVDVKSGFSKKICDIKFLNSQMLIIGDASRRRKFLSQSDPKAFKNRNGNLLRNSAFAGVAGNEFLKTVIDVIVEKIENYTPHIDGVGLKGVFSTTGPYAFTRALAAMDNKETIAFVSEQESGYIFRRAGTRKASQAVGRRHYSCNLTPVTKHNPSHISALSWKISHLLAAIIFSPGVIEGRIKHLLQ